VSLRRGDVDLFVLEFSRWLLRSPLEPTIGIDGYNAPIFAVRVHNDGILQLEIGEENTFVLEMHGDLPDLLAEIGSVGWRSFPAEPVLPRHAARSLNHVPAVTGDRFQEFLTDSFLVGRACQSLKIENESFLSLHLILVWVLLVSLPRSDGWLYFPNYPSCELGVFVAVEPEDSGEAPGAQQD
jgi:hypothetical protein